MAGHVSGDIGQFLRYVVGSSGAEPTPYETSCKVGSAPLEPTYALAAF
jgi:hypothetical protein